MRTGDERDRFIDMVLVPWEFTTVELSPCSSSRSFPRGKATQEL